ncbi:MAG: hypothetical protein KDK30_16320 [Leptospiraceae bacterium]|nr:hypothetical protein [Leptospiraceae bacterium]
MRSPSTHRRAVCMFAAVIMLVFGSGGPLNARETDSIERDRAFILTELDEQPESRGLRNQHYPCSNEMRIDLFRPYIQDLGGGYMGVGTDQNFTFIAWARSEYAWLFDFDDVSVYVNRIHMYFFSIAPRYEDFRALWQRSNRESSLKILEARFGGNSDWPGYLRAWQIAHRGSTDVPERLLDLERMHKQFGLETFSSSAAQYRYIRFMVIQGRIQAVPGDLKGTVTMQSIAAAARRMDLPIRVFYTSNAEEYMRYPDTMRANIRAIPVDHRSLLLRTASVGARNVLGHPPGEKFPEDPFHYNIQPIEVLQRWMDFPRPLRVLDMLQHNRRSLGQGFSIQEKGPYQLHLISRDRSE